TSLAATSLAATSLAATSLAVLWGIVSTTRSPIITVAVLNDTKARGPLADHVLSVVVLQSAATLPLFFAALVWARADVVSGVGGVGGVGVGGVGGVGSGDVGAIGFVDAMKVVTSI